ncbi:tryptophan synthase subunit alpha [Lysinibacillus fusiformis]|uniref:Tryptophan synthase alpha chain n=1 Tax=Lysinibacillus fusiformis TaxID=28031 RepID=A0A1H9NM93_9BACI|nr:tryptophan synthase subunit alpha [Lysinibacillus fusiformis]SCY67647.1 tryptophan synthase, alpha chain [Lysinibacillus fusiformis]SEO09887.1 tryptophan synthase, alpha chain [Lysinibacillus fusiformis]SER37068.1 tryptophan synthase, alpha chain [Lysinibacillus fusiformis]
MTTLQQAIDQTKLAGHKAFIPYMMAGDGGLETVKPTILKLQQLGVTAIEVGIPFTDPVADGPTIERAGERALVAGVTLRKVLQALASFKEEITVPLVIMTYFNPVLAYGLEAFAQACVAGGVKGIIVPDVPFEESGILREALNPHSIDVIQLVSLTSPPERITRIAAASQGFVYAVTVNGITGERSNFATNLEQHFASLRQASPIPVLAGFGISTPEQVKSMGMLGDGVIVGSAVVTALHEGRMEAIEALIAASKGIYEKSTLY